MDFELGNPWHWLFLAVALPASARSACKAFFSEFNASHNPLLSPVLEFWIALFGTCGGWFALWHLLPVFVGCADPPCAGPVTIADLGLGAGAVIGIGGLLPECVHGALRMWLSATGGGDVH